MRAKRFLLLFLLISSTLFAVPKYFYLRTVGTPEGARYDAGRNLIYVSSPQTSQVFAFSSDTGQLQKSIYVPNAGGLDITPDGKQLVVGTTAYFGWFGNSFLTFIDLDSFTIADRIPISNPIQADSGRGGSINTPYIRSVIALYNGDIVFSVSPQNSTERWMGRYEQATRKFSLLISGVGLLVPSDDRKQVLLNTGLSGGLTIYDADQKDVSVNNPQLSDSFPFVFSHDRKLVAHYTGQGTTLLLDGSTLQIVRTIVTPTAGFQLAFSSDNTKLYVQKFATCGFYVFDVNTGYLVGDVSMPGDDHDQFNLLEMDSLGRFYSAMDRGLTVTDSNQIGFFDPPSQSTQISYPYVASPSGGPISGGNAVTVKAGYPARPSVYFGGKLAQLNGSNSTGLQVVAPAGDRLGPVDITIYYDNGHVVYIPEGYSYGPSIEYLDHTGGSSAGGDAITVFAKGLRSTSTADVQVSIGGVSATVSAVTALGISPMKSPTYRVKVVTPAGNAGAADVSLTTADGSTVLKGGFTYSSITNSGGGNSVSQLLYDDSRALIYRCNYGINGVEVLTDAGQYVKTYPTHQGPIALALSPDRSRLYVTAGNGYIDIIDLISGTPQWVQLTLPTNFVMTRIGVTSKGTLFVGIFDTTIYYDSRLIEVDPVTGTYKDRLKNFNGNYLEIGMSRDGSHGLISSDIEPGASGNSLYYWDSFTDTFRGHNVVGWSDYGVDDAASMILGGVLTTDNSFNIHDVFVNASYDLNESFIWGEKMDASGALALIPGLKSLFIYDVHQGNQIAQVALPSQGLPTLDAMAFDSIHSTAYILSSTGLLKVNLPNLFAIGRLEPNQGLAGGGQSIIVRGIGFRPNATVQIGGISAPTVFVDSTTLQIAAPALPLGPASVQVTNPDGRTYEAAGAYTAVDSQPIIIGTSPSKFRSNSGFSGQTLDVIGMSFAPGAVALWNGSARTTYFIDDTTVHVELNSSDTVALGAGVIAVKNPDGAVSNSVTIPIEGYPMISLPAGFHFGKQVVNSTAVQSATVTNSGPTAVSLSLKVAEPFKLTTDCQPSIPAGSSCTISVSFSPTSPGNYSSGIVLGGDVSGAITVDGIAGLAAATVTVTPDQVKFGSINLNTQSNVNVLIQNIGMPDVAINKVYSDSSEFRVISYLGPSLITTQSGEVSVTFEPSGLGSRVGNLIVDSSAGVIKVPLTGTGAQLLGFDTAALTISALKGQTTPSKAVTTFTNSGGVGVSITGVSISSGTSNPPFSQTNDCPSVLTPGASCKITVSFVPTGTSTETAGLMVSHDMLNSFLPLNGTVTDFSMGATTSSATVAAGQSASYPVVIDSSAGYRGTLSMSCLGAPAYSTCTISPQTVTASGTPTNVTVSVTTTARTSAGLSFPKTSLLVFAFMLMGGVFVRKPMKRKAAFMLILIGVCTFNACGGGGGGSSAPKPQTVGTPAGTYQLTVIAATPEGGTRKTTLNLTVN
jgi:hypothetical protein